MPTEDPEEFRQFREGMHAQFEPWNALEVLLVDQMVAAAWKMRRLLIVETAFLGGAYFEILEEQAEREAEDSIEIVPTQMEILLAQSRPKPAEASPGQQEKLQGLRRQREQAAVPLGQAYLRGLQGSDILSKFQRYQASVERSFYRAVLIFRQGRK